MGDDYSDLVTWADTRNPARYQDYALLGTWIRRSDGKVLDPEPIVISDHVGNELFSSLAPAGKGRALVVYQVFDYAAGFGHSRIRARFVGSGAANAAACTSDADCITRACSDGVCCDRACKGACETCTGTGGKCTPVVNAEDPDTCKGDDVCSAASACKRKAGRGCAIDTDCSTGHCADGICCDTACNAPCEACAPLTGVCALRGARSAGKPICAPYACDGQSATCPTKCTSDLSCPVGTRCEQATGFCVSGTSCIDLTTAALADQTPVDCAPYTCSGGTCRTSCRSVEDCVSPLVCDEKGACVPPSAPAPVEGGCTVTSPRSSPAAYVPALLAAVALIVARRRERRADGSRAELPVRSSSRPR